MSTRKDNSRRQTRRRIRRVAFFAPTGSEYVSRLSEGVLRYQSENPDCIVHDFRFNASEPEDTERWASRPRPWDSWSADGLLVNVSSDPGLAEWVAAGGQPVVNTGLGPNLPSVSISSNDVAIEAIRHFRSCGLTDFAFVSQVHRSRLEGFYQARLNEIGIVPHIVRVSINPTEWDYSAEEIAILDTNLQQMLLTAPKPLAVLAHNDALGRVVCLAAQRLGLKVPREIAVLGIGDFAPSRSANPPLSSIHTPGDEVGYRAMQLLGLLMDRQPAPRLIEVPPGKVVIRGTSGNHSRMDHAVEVTRALQIIRERACEGIGIKEILNMLNISQSTLLREFKRVVGRTPIEEIMRVRLERAKELLQNSGLSIAQISTAIGFKSQTNFTVFFKSKTGLTPLAYRDRRGR